MVHLLAGGVIEVSFEEDASISQFGLKINAKGLVICSISEINRFLDGNNDGEAITVLLSSFSKIPSKLPHVPVVVLNEAPRKLKICLPRSVRTWILNFSNVVFENSNQMICKIDC